MSEYQPGTCRSEEVGESITPPAGWQDPTIAPERGAQP
jgi:hypothetical protein